MRRVAKYLRTHPKTSAWLPTAAVFALALLTYGLTAFLLEHHTPSMANYFDYLAQAFLRGRLHLVEPPSYYDLTPHDGRWYVPFPPLGALLLLPGVWWSGVAGTNPLTLSILFGAWNVTLLWAILERLTLRGWAPLGFSSRVWLTLLFGLGSVHWHIATEGSVWFFAQTTAFTFVALATWLALAGAPGWLSGFALAIALLGRPNLLLLWPLLLGVFLRREPRRRDACFAAALSLVPCALSLAALGAYNHARFGAASDFGYRAQNVSPSLAADLHEHGQFSLAFLPRNAALMLFGGPVLEAGRIRPNDAGMSILLTTPALLLLVFAFPRDALTRCAWLATLVTFIPLLLYYNTGWRQFGYRFSLDAMLPMLVLLAIAWPRCPRRFAAALTLVGIGVNLWGVVWWHWGWP